MNARWGAYLIWRIGQRQKKVFGNPQHSVQMAQQPLERFDVNMYIHTLTFVPLLIPCLLLQKGKAKECLKY